MKKIIFVVFSLMLLSSVAIMRNIPVSAAPPAPNLHVVAIAEEEGPIVTLTIEITNSGGADSGQLDLLVVLPDHQWSLGRDAFGKGDCSLDGDVLKGHGYVPKRGLNDEQTGFTDGLAICEVYAPITPCGEYEAFALVYDSDTTEKLVSNLAEWSRPCATPTKVPTATPTATPTPFIQPTPTTTPFAITATPTVATTRVIPLPPNTGSGESASLSATDGLFSLYMWFFLLVLLPPLSIIIVFKLWMWIRQ